MLCPSASFRKYCRICLRSKFPSVIFIPFLKLLRTLETFTKDADLLTEHVRQALSRQITRQYQTPDGLLPLITMNQELENQVAGAIQDSGQGAYLGLNPNVARPSSMDWMKMEQFSFNNYQPLLLCSPLIRPHEKTG